jgi:hypothetical protein
MSLSDEWFDSEWGQFGKNYAEYNKEDMQGAFKAGMEVAAVIADRSEGDGHWIARAIRGKS